MPSVQERIERILHLSLRGGNAAEQQEAKALLARIQQPTEARFAAPQPAKKGARK